jgi:putative ABC transport system substrate-binding protein
MMPRRTFVLAVAAVVTCGPSRAAAQSRQPRKIALLMPTSTEPHFWAALKRQLAELGYVEGRDMVYESRSAEGRFERLPALAEELVRARPDVIVTASTPGVRAAKAATATIPIVIATAGDPVRMGAVASLARPGGNITGVSNIAGETAPKVLELARSTLPKLSRVAFLWNPANPSWAGPAATRDAAAQNGLALLELQARVPAEIDAAFASLAKEPAGALIVLSDPFLVSQREKIGSLARAQGVPVFTQMLELVQAGALMSYGPDYAEHFRRAASFVDRILKGAKPGDLPIEQAATFALVLNRKTAAALGIAIPQSVLLRATEVIE